MPDFTATEKFRFSSRLSLPELTGLKAANLEQLLNHLRDVSGSCIYHHTHRFLQQHLNLSPEPPNDFAYWVTNTLGEDELGERLASINIVEFSSIRMIREKMIEMIENYLADKPAAGRKFTGDSEAFHFIKSISFVFPTHHEAGSLREFADKLKLVSVDSIYFHMFEARLRLEKGGNDFSLWLETAANNKPLADKLSRLDPYTFTSEGLRKTLVMLVEQEIKK